MNSTTKRREDWPERLAEYLRSKRGQPFVWGANDCALLTCGAVLAMTEVDLAADFRGKYTDAASATKVMLQVCGGNLEKLAEKIAADRGFQEVKPALARRGDVVLFDVRDDEAVQGPALGVVALNGHTAHSTGPGGAVVVPIKAWRRAWRIG
jgi:cell wall-associated NlpC family hydrolase